MGSLPPSLRNLDNESTAWSLTPARWAASKSNLDSRRCQHDSLLEASDGFSIHFSESGSALIVSYVPSRYGSRSSIAYKMSRRCRCIVSYTWLALVSKREHYPIGFVDFSGWYFNNYYPSRTSQASVSGVVDPSAYSNAKTGAEISFSWSLFIASGVFLFSAKWNGCSFYSLVLNCDKMPAKLGTISLKTLQRAMISSD